MPFTDVTLKAKIQQTVQSDESSFVDNLDLFITQAEDIISKAVILPANRKYAPVNLTEGDPNFDVPSDFLAPFEMRIAASGVFTPVEYVDTSLIREAFPNPLMVGTPRWYSMFNSSEIIVAPTPTSGLTAWLNYFYKPESITTAGTSWLGTNAENCLFYGCLVQAYIYLMGEADLMKTYDDKFQAALNDLRKLGEGMDMGDAYRMGEIRVAKGMTGAKVSG